MKTMLFILFCLLTQSCVILDKTYSFKTSSEYWKENHTGFKYQDNYQLSFTYMDGDDYVIYPVVCYNAFLFSPLPVVIPILPNLFPMISGKNNDFKIIIKSRRKFSPDDITCTIDGKQVFPYSIDSLHVFYTSDGKKMTNWHNCWNEDSIYKYPHPSPYKTPNNWNTLPSFENECEVRYYYNVKHISISEIEISFADGKEPLRLRLKKGLFYTWSYPIVYR